MLNKKIVKSILLVGLVLVCVLAFSPKVRAITASEIQQQITLLLAQIKQLQQQLAELQGNQAVAWCHSFNKNLRIKDRGSEVEALIKALKNDGITIPEIDSYGATGPDDFLGEGVASAVVEFQEKYTNEILKPYGLKRGTGYVGKSTRVKLNKLYGCNNQPVACTADAKQCPDGSYVSRTGANCEFAQCPTMTCAKEGEKTLSWQSTLTCCAGLTKIGNPDGYAVGASGLCAMNLSNGSICAYCGNGVCGTGENQCSCPSDCKETTTSTFPVCSQ